jgi:predicted dehydrogenase
MQSSPTRRTFLKKTAAAAGALSAGAVSYGRILGANDRLSIAVIGCGDRGFNAHMKGVQQHADSQNIEITAVCDPWRIRRERAAAQTREWYGRAARRFVSYRDVVTRDDIDAVMIASCDHQHEAHLLATAQAKKDVYVEKPLGMDFSRTTEVYDAVRASGIVCQVGTQVRSWPTSAGCRRLFATGVFGRLSRVEQCRNGNRPYWYNYLERASPEDVDWDEFLMDRPREPFSSDRFTGWYGYRGFSDGPVPALGSHFIDLMSYITDAAYPESCVCHGGTFTWNDDHAFTCPDQVQAVWTYPEGFLVSYSTNFGNGGGNVFRLYGTEGVLDLTNWTRPAYTTGADVRAAPGEGTEVEAVETPDHFLDWLQCIRSRETCNAPIEAGYRHAVAVIMAVRAFDTGRRQTFDRQRREIRPV